MRNRRFQWWAAEGAPLPSDTRTYVSYLVGCRGGAGIAGEGIAASPLECPVSVIAERGVRR